MLSAEGGGSPLTWLRRRKANGEGDGGRIPGIVGALTNVLDNETWAQCTLTSHGQRHFEEPLFESCSDGEVSQRAKGTSKVVFSALQCHAAGIIDVSFTAEKAAAGHLLHAWRERGSPSAGKIWSRRSPPNYQASEVIIINGPWGE